MAKEDTETTGRMESGAGASPGAGAVAAAGEAYEALALVKEYARPVLLGLGLAALVYLGLVWFRVRKHRREEEASFRLAGAATAEHLQQLLRDYGNAAVAPAAQLQLAAAYLHSGQAALAEEAFREFERRYPDHFMRPAAQLGQAYCAEAAGQWEEAITRFTAFVQQHKDHFLTPMAELGRARCLEQAGRLEEARAAYEDFIASHPDSRWKAQAETSLLYVQKEMRARESQ